MAALRKVLEVGLGVLAGAVGAWVLARLYVYYLGTTTGFFAVPILLVAAIAAVLARKPRLRFAAVALVVGALVEAAFFLWLFSTMGEDLRDF